MPDNVNFVYPSQITVPHSKLLHKFRNRYDLTFPNRLWPVKKADTFLHPLKRFYIFQKNALAVPVPEYEHAKEIFLLKNDVSYDANFIILLKKETLTHKLYKCTSFISLFQYRYLFSVNDVLRFIVMIPNLTFKLF